MSIVMFCIAHVGFIKSNWHCTSSIIVLRDRSISCPVFTVLICTEEDFEAKVSPFSSEIIPAAVTVLTYRFIAGLRVSFEETAN